MSHEVIGPSDLHSLLTASGRAFPFRCELSLQPLIDLWTKGIAAEQSVKGALGRMVESELRRAPEMFDPIEDLSLITRHRELVDVLMSTIFPPAFWEQEYGAALVPFQLRSFYATPSFERMLMDGNGILRGRINGDGATASRVRLRYAYGAILRRVYGIEADVDVPLVFTVTDHDTGLDRHFKMSFDSRFLDVVPLGQVPSLGDRDRQEVKVVDPEALMALLPPENFVFRGFTVFKAVEVTDHEVLSSLKRDLIEKESVVSAAGFQILQSRLQTLFRRPSLRLGLAAVEGDQVLMLNYADRMEHSCIFADSAHHQVAEFAGSIYDRAAKQGRPLVVDDLTTYAPRTHVEDDLICGGLRNIVVAPLRYQDALIGMLELASPNPGELTIAHLPKLEEVMPLFSMAVKRSMEELESRIQAYIKEKCTAIHPSVEWRFRKAVLNGLERQRQGDATALTEMEPIVFDGVFPLYGLSDIRGSSTQRAFAIQTDLLTQLSLARDVLTAAHEARPLPALDELAYRVDKHIADIEVSLRSGDEMAVITFLRNEVESLFDHLQTFGPDARARVDAYRQALEPRLGTVYQRRKAFEESVTLINETISSYLEMEEQAAQTMFPHYFEKQKTDGVDYGIYVGASLLEDGRFDPLYLKNLRLWQLMVACGVAIRTERLKSRLAVPLEAAHLILVQHQPLSIRFRFDEKRFDVDGAYNIRYEIIKKRIDKATIRGTTERLTQPAKIAIVYAQPREAAEYRDYIEYLQHLRYLGPQIEELELDELQGVHGLRALRVAVELDNPRLEGRVPLQDLQSAV
jgi:GAF domain-containing protein